MNKFLLAFGKCLIIVATLWPIGIWLENCYGFSWWRGIYFWCAEIRARIFLALHPGSHWYIYSLPQNIDYWIMGTVFIVGFLLCLISRYKGELVKEYAKTPVVDSIVGLVLTCCYWVLLMPIGFWVLVLGFKLFHFCFLTPAIEYVVPGMFLSIIFGALILIGVWWYRQYTQHKNDPNDNIESDRAERIAKTCHAIERKKRQKRRRNVKLEDINYKVDMNKARREELLEVVELLEEANQRLSEIRDDEQDAFDSLPDSLQDSINGQNMLDAMDVLDDFYSMIDRIGDKITEYAKPKKKSKKG